MTMFQYFWWFAILSNLFLKKCLSLFKQAFLNQKKVKAILTFLHNTKTVLFWSNNFDYSVAPLGALLKQ